MRQWVAVVFLGLAVGAVHAQRDGELAPLSGEATVAQRAAFYERVAGVRSTALLDELASQVAESPPDDLRRFQLDAIVERYLELDAAKAVRIAGDLMRADAHDLVRRIYVRLGRTDVNAALSALSEIEDPNEERVAADAIVEALGGNTRALDLVSAALHGVDRDEFRASNLLRLARTSPRDAFEIALGLRNPNLRISTARSIIAGWASTAPDDAIAALRNVDDPALRSSLRNVVSGSLHTAESIVAYLDSLPNAEHEEALANGLLARLAELDPKTATEFVNAMPQGAQRNQLAMQIGMAYAQQDPAGALAWASGPASDIPELPLAIVRGVALADPLRAFDLALALDEPARTQGVLSAVATGGNVGRYPALADRVLRLPDGQTRSTAVLSLLSSWAATPGNAAAALEWALANANAVPPESFERLGYQVAQADPATAARYLDRVPIAGRAGWLSAVTVSYAMNDPQAALSFIERYRGDAGFDRAVTALAPHLARTDPPAAARLLGSVSERTNEGLSAEFQVVQQWAQRDPAAAAAWAIDQPPMQRNALVGFATSAWAQTDRDGLRRWALSMPSGEKRDAALAAALRSFGTEPDAALLNAFSDDRARQGAMLTVVMNAAMTDRDAAHRLVQTYISEPRMRAQAEQMIETVPRGAMPSPAVGFGFGVPPGIVLRGSTTGAQAAGPITLPAPGVRFNGPPPALFAPNGTVVTVPAIQVPIGNSQTVIATEAD
jgi:hypothetical protein